MRLKEGSRSGEEGEEEEGEFCERRSCDQSLDHTQVWVLNEVVEERRLLWERTGETGVSTTRRIPEVERVNPPTHHNKCRQVPLTAPETRPKRSPARGESSDVA